MIKHIISPIYKILELKEDVSGSKMGLKSKLDENILVLNEDIAFCINLYKTPQYFSEILHQFALKYEATESEIKPIVLQFFELLNEKGILVSESDATRLSQLKHEPPSRVGETILGFYLEKRLTFVMPIDIYRAKNEAGEAFLVKILVLPLNPSNDDKRFWKRCFKNEFEILKRLSADSDFNGICRFISFDSKKEVGVTSFFDNSESLLKRIEDNPIKLKIDEKIKIFKQLTSVLAFIHSKNILHGDLHTSNILINDRGEVCLIDFDLAIQLDKKKNEDLAWGGALEFIPPENINQNAFEKVKTYPTLLSELFQLGVVGYFIFYEKLPFDGRTWAELAQAISQENPNFESDTVPLSIQTFLKQILSKNLSGRHVDLGLIQF
jgi:eukaryotic-like serine/threonine-protein kinase